MDEKSTEPVSIAYYCTGHGYGHATRSIEVTTHFPISIPLTLQGGDAALSGASKSFRIT